MKRAMYFMFMLVLVWRMSGVTSAVVVSVRVARDATGATQEFAQMLYTGGTINYG